MSISEECAVRVFPSFKCRGGECGRCEDEGEDEGRDGGEGCVDGEQSFRSTAISLRVLCSECGQCSGCEVWAL